MLSRRSSMTRFSSPGSVSGIAKAPASKSSMQRAVACAALACGDSALRSPSLCADGRAALAVAEALGAEVSIGAERTAEELGQAFAKVPVISSTGAKPVRQVPDKPGAGL